MKFVDLRVFMEDFYPGFVKESVGYKHPAFAQIKASMYSVSAVCGRLWQ